MFGYMFDEFSRTLSSAWVIFMSAGLSTVVTLLEAMISTQGTLCTRMAHISVGADLMTRRRNIVLVQVYSTSDFESLSALWALFCGGTGMPDFEVSTTFVVGLGLSQSCLRLNQLVHLCSSLIRANCR